MFLYLFMLESLGGVGTEITLLTLLTMHWLKSSTVSVGEDSMYVNKATVHM